MGWGTECAAGAALDSLWPMVEVASAMADIVTTLIGRGHSGTRAYSKLLVENGFFMGPKLNSSFDYKGEGLLYEAARIFGRYVTRTGEHEWDFSKAIEAPIPDDFIELLERYLAPIHDQQGKPRGWKLPETILIFPWLVRLYPDLHYVHWVRDPRDSMLSDHVTDDMARFGAPAEFQGDPKERGGKRYEMFWRRAASWKYQYDIVEHCPKPKRWLVVRFEDFVLEPEATVQQISEFLGVPLTPIPTDPSRVGRWQRKWKKTPEFEFLAPLMQKYGYS